MIVALFRSKVRSIWSLPMFIFGAVLQLNTVLETKYSETDWIAYSEASPELVHTTWFGGDKLFWILLVNANLVIDAASLHVILKITSMIFVLAILMRIGVNFQNSLLSATIWSGTTGFALATDWYIRQSIANMTCLFGWACLLDGWSSKKNDKIHHGFAVSIVGVILVVFSTFIHFGLIYFNVLILIVSFCLSGWVKSRLNLQGPAMFGILGKRFLILGVIVSILAIANNTRGESISETLVIRNDVKAIPYSAILQIVLMIVTVLYLLAKINTLKSKMVNDSARVGTVFLITLSFHIFVLGELIASNIVGVFYVYMLRINTFKDLYNVVSIGLMLELQRLLGVRGASGGLIQLSIANIVYLIIIASSRS
jgi:hypothetical protein